MTTPIFDYDFNSNKPDATWNTPTAKMGNVSQRGGEKADLGCLSHLRWNFVYQRPQHLLGRAARDRRVFVIEEPIYDNGSMHLEVNECEDGV